MDEMAGLDQNLVLEIHEAALDDSAWERLPGILRASIGADSAVLWVAGSAGLRISGCNQEEKSLRLYTEHYRQLDPWVKSVLENSLFSQVFVSEDLISQRALKNSEFYCDFLAPSRTRGAIGGMFHVNASTMAGFGIHLSDKFEFTQRQKNTIKTLLPHLSQAVRVRDRLVGTGSRQSIAFVLAQQLSTAIVVCSKTGIVVFANRSAEELNRANEEFFLGSSALPIHVRSGEQSRRLQRYVADAATGGPGGALIVGDKPGSRLLLTVSPFASLNEVPEGALVTLREEDATPVLPRNLSEMFSLTPVEAEIASALSANRSLAQIRDSRNITENTIRTHLAHILDKTATANQRELVRLLSYTRTI